MKAPLPRTRPLSILIVDDYADAAISLGQLLSMGGFATRTAFSGPQALSAAAAEPPDVLIIEPRTIGCDWELPRRMAKTTADKRLLLVVVTSDATLAGRRAAQAAGVGIYMVKPGDPTLVLGVLREFEWRGRTDPGFMQHGIQKESIPIDSMIGHALPNSSPHVVSCRLNSLGQCRN